VSHFSRWFPNGQPWRKCLDHVRQSALSICETTLRTSINFTQTERVVHIHTLGAHLPHCKASLLAQHNICTHTKPQKRNILYGILTTMRLKPTVTWEVLFCSLVHEYRCFGVKYCTRIHPEVHRYIYARSPIFIDLKTWSSCFLLTLGTYPSNCTQTHLIREISVIFIFPSISEATYSR